MDRREYMKQYREEHKCENNKEKIAKYRRKYEQSEKGKRARHNDYIRHREARLKYSREYHGRTKWGDIYANYKMNIVDFSMMPLFEDILLNREIAEIEIKIKYKEMNL